MNSFKHSIKRGRLFFSELYWSLTPLWMVTWIEWDPFIRNAEGGLVEMYSGFHASWWNAWCLLGLPFIQDRKNLARALFGGLILVALHTPWGSSKEIWSVPFWIISFFLLKEAINQKSFLKAAIWVGCFEIALGLKQIFTGTDGGFNFLGEPHLGKGISEIAHGRPYGTFPHPNLLGAWMALWALQSKSNLWIFGTLMSLSRTAILMLLGRMNKIMWVVAGVVIAVRSYTTWGSEAFQRFTAWPQAIRMLVQNPMGVGQGEFIQKWTQMHPNILPWEIQPVHNSFLLFLTEWGWFTFGWVALSFYLFKLKPIRKNVAWALSAGFMLDHFWVSLPQGGILAAFGLALLVSSPQNNGVESAQTS